MMMMTMRMVTGVSNGVCVELMMSKGRGSKGQGGGKYLDKRLVWMLMMTYVGK